MAQVSTRKRSVIVWYRGNPYRLDLERCRRTFARLQAEGELRSMRALADQLGVRRSIVAGFFTGQPTSLTVTIKVLDALHLAMANIVRPLDGDDDTDASGGAVGNPARHPSTPGGDQDCAACPLERVATA